MIKSKKLLIAVDGSPHSLKAVSYVALNCAAVNPRINLMYVISTAPEAFWDFEKGGFFKRKMRAKYTDWKKNEEKAAEAFLDEARKLMLQAKIKEEDINIIHRERLVGVARDIISESSEGYDALVLGRRGSSKMEDLFPGSVSYKIAQGVENTPIWVIGDDIPSRKMLLAVDGSENCRRAVDYVGTFAAATGVELTLFSVVRDFKLQLLDVSTPRGEEIEIKLLEEVERDIRSMIDSYKERLEQAGVKGTRISIKLKLRSQTRAGDILEEASKGNYGTLIIGRRGLSAIQELPLGRVATKVLHRAKGTAVWIVP
ncbi:MAG: universal stress protein [Syntrophobacterales bacterium]|jgi:nucleotide-binding universal stress UspA family protein